MTTPLVGVTSWRGVFPTYAGPQLLDTLEIQYSDCVRAAGMIPLIIPNGQPAAMAAQIVPHLDGLLLTGGGDIDPEMYGGDRVRVEEEDIAVDRFEVALVHQARDLQIPVLAICRGLQLLNVAFGGTLVQDVAEEMAAHEPIIDGSDPDELEARRHVVSLQPGGVLEKIYGLRDLKVNTLHHQGIDVISDDLIVEGRAPDGLVEAARSGGPWWALGVQWHPERLAGEHSEPLFTVFREAIEAP